MGRMHTHNHGKAHSIRPIELKKPDWIKMESKEIEELIVKYANENRPDLAKAPPKTPKKANLQPKNS